MVYGVGGDGGGSGCSNNKYNIFSLNMTIYLSYKIIYLYRSNTAIIRLTASKKKEIFTVVWV